MKCANPYTGPENIQDYLAWLAVEYPWSVDWPPNTEVNIDGCDYLVMGYSFTEDDDLPCLTLTPISAAKVSYEYAVESSVNIHLTCVEAIGKKK